MFLATILWESDGLKALREYFCYPKFNQGCEYSTGIGPKGVNYYGRGFIQLSWDYNYKSASQYIVVLFLNIQNFYFVNIYLFI
jgi:hypothetical protein